MTIKILSNELDNETKKLIEKVEIMEKQISHKDKELNHKDQEINNLKN